MFKQLQLQMNEHPGPMISQYKDLPSFVLSSALNSCTVVAFVMNSDFKEIGDTIPETGAISCYFSYCILLLLI